MNFLVSLCVIVVFGGILFSVYETLNHKSKSSKKHI